jgi:uncharacterized protein GlcG (DUF336 family)
MDSAPRNPSVAAEKAVTAALKTLAASREALSAARDAYVFATDSETRWAVLDACDAAEEFSRCADKLMSAAYNAQDKARTAAQAALVAADEKPRSVDSAERSSQPTVQMCSANGPFLCEGKLCTTCLCRYC